MYDNFSQGLNQDIWPFNSNISQLGVTVLGAAIVDRP